MKEITSFGHGGDYNPEQWLDHPEIIAQDFEYFKKAHINTITVGIFSWAQLEPSEGNYRFDWLDDIFDRAEKQGINVILATPSGARPRWMADQYPEVLRVDENGQRNLFGERHNHCYTSPIYREKIQAIDRKLAERYGQRSNLVLWHVSNEFGGACYCDLCQNAFRHWLKEKYQTLENLNKAYWATFWSHTYTNWDQVVAPSPRGDQNLLGLNLDWHRFVSDQTIDFYEAEAEVLREVTPDIKITTNFMGGNPDDEHVFFDLDYQKFAEHVDIVSWDSYPSWRTDNKSSVQLAMNTAAMNDVMRSLKHDNYMIMESTPSQVNWHPFNRPKAPGMHRMGALQEVSHGANAINYFQLHQSRGSSEMFHGAVIGHDLRDDTRIFKEVAQVGDNLEHLQPALNAKAYPAKVAIVYDYDNMWALSDVRNYASQTIKYWQTIQEHYQYFWEHDVPVEFISTSDELTDYKLVIDPMHFMMTETFANKLKEYVAEGGTVVGTYITGQVDERYLAYIGGWPQALHDVYGVEPIETDTLYPSQRVAIETGQASTQAHDYATVLEVDQATAIAKYTSEWYADTAAITKNQYDNGQAYYVGARFDSEFMASFYDALVTDLDLQVPTAIHKTDVAIHINVRADEQASYYFVTNFSDVEQTFTVTTPMQDLLTGTTVGVGTYEMSAYESKVLVK
ncbi:Beta-galactosidase [Weissella jogaejeotgali]|uniref:Beta-galactosidase n=2 Tax=Weissella TaxID=46255 RepID=A0A1L6R995_9LACO|nr:beta-galactosidase [Weissella jogaejeotgali]APS41078.1 Beta-galactosidase [Weissella jogaejeotgali]CCC56508.1 beta-galactosidase [Weissella thailandensis fsh4-2]